MQIEELTDDNFNFDDIIAYSPETTQDEDDSIEIAQQISVYKCQKCDFVTEKIEVVQNHYKLHIHEFNDYEEEVILLCSICYAQFSNENNLRNHMIEDHNLKPLPNGEKINRSSEKKQNVQTEAVRANEEIVRKEQTVEVDREAEDKKKNPEAIKPVPFKYFRTILRRKFIHKCTLPGCSFKFDSIEKLDSHLKCHTSTSKEHVREFKCLECAIEGHSWRDCSTHMWKVHQIDLDLLSCPLQCTYKAISADQIWRHMKTHKKWKSKVLKSIKETTSKEPKDNCAPKHKYYVEKTCEICDRKFVNGKTLSKHVKSVHNKIKPFICNVCGMKSARKSTLNIHMRQHTGEKPLSCPHCDFATRDPSVLANHKKRHQDSKKYNCTECPFTSIQTSNLKFHIKVNHPEAYKKICCNLCNFTTINTDALERHKRDHDKGLIVINEDSVDVSRTTTFKNPAKFHTPEKLHSANREISSDCFLPIESTDSIAHDPALDTGGVTIPAHSEDTQFPTFLSS